MANTGDPSSSGSIYKGISKVKEGYRRITESSDPCVTRLICGKGDFNVEGLDKFVKEVKLADSGTSYTVVAIMGPQSSGKSTLLNNLFQTKFRMMDAQTGRSQTTQGVWMAKCVGISPCTIAMDLEGSDGRERGQDDTTFERQIALFALAVADIVIINMWCHEIGREQAANKPLLRTVFQAMMRLFGHKSKTTLLFVLRDKSKTPVEMLKSILIEDIQKIWDEVPKREAHKKTTFNEIFRVEVVALSSYERDEDTFKEEVAQLRNRLLNSTSLRGLAGDRRRAEDVPGSLFSRSSKQFWGAIKEDRDLDLPSHKVMLASVRCDEILNEKLDKLDHDEVLLQVKREVEIGLVPGLGTRLSGILVACRIEYEEATKDFDQTVRTKKGEVLESKVLEVLYPVFTSMLVHQRSKAFEDFKVRLNASMNNGEELFESVRIHAEKSMNEFDKGYADAVIKHVHWDASKIRDKLRSDIEAHANSIYHDNTISDLKRLNLQNQEKSQELIDKMVQKYEEHQRAAQAQLDRLVELRKEDEKQLKKLIEMHAKDQKQAKDQLDKLEASLAAHKGELEERDKWGPFYFIRQLFRESQDILSMAADLA